MGRRKAMRLPEMRLHKPSGKARIRVNGKDIWLGPFGSQQALDRYNDEIAKLAVAGPDETQTGRKMPPAASPAPLATVLATLPEVTAELTVGELCVAWLRDIQRARGEAYGDTSLWYGARAAVRALRPYAAMPAVKFGPRAMLEVREQFALGHVIHRDGSGKVVSDKPRSRRYVNDVMGRIVQLFRWAAVRELIPGDRPAALREVPALRAGELAAVRETRRREVVPADVFDATVAKLSPAMRRIVLFIRYTGCRPSEAAALRLDDVQDRDQPVWRYQPERHKNAWRGHTRAIPIGPRAQAVALEALGRRKTSELVFVTEPSGHTIPIRATGQAFTTGAIRQAIQKAAAAAGVPKWFTYQLRHTRTHEVRRDHGRDAAQAVLGDRSASMLENYSEADWSLACEASLATG